jgi:RND superfamily putative drug exporter
VGARWWIVVGWVVVLAALITISGRVEPGGDKLASIIPLDSPAIQAEIRSVEEFGFPLSSRIVVVQRDPGGLSRFTQARAVLAAIGVDQTPQPAPLLGALPLTNSIKLSGSTGETDTAVITYLFMNPRSGFARQEAAAQRYVTDHLDRPDDHVVGIAGSIPARAEQAVLVNENLPRMELLTVLAIIVLVALTFRSVLAPVLALGCSAVAFVVTLHLSELLGSLAGITAPAELEPLLVALLLGVVTDYTIFYLSALQSRAREGQEWRDAVVGAVSSYTPIVIAAGLTVAAGTAALLAASSEFFKGFAPAMALSVLVGLAVSVTLVPAMLAILGPAVFWPRRPRPANVTLRSRQWRTGRLRRAVRDLNLYEHLTRRRTAALVLAGALAVLLLASLPLRNIDLGVGFTASLPSDNPVSQASRQSSIAFAPGINSPTTLLFEGPGVTDRLQELSDLQAGIRGLPGVAMVLGPAENFTQREFDIVLARSGNAARMLIVFDSDPLGASAINHLSALQAELPGLLAASGLDDVDVLVAGDTALAEGLVESTKSDLWRIALAAIIVNLIVLIVFLRALVAPLFLLTSSVLALTASMGITVALFMGIRGNEDLTFYVPFAAAVLLVALGSDYNIFGVGHVWEEAGHLPLNEAIIKAVPESTRAIMAAGITLAVSFGMLAVIPLRPFRELAFAMSVGILIDVIVVRSLLVPSLLTLFGPMSGWPGPHLRRPPTSADDAASPVASA